MPVTNRVYATRARHALLTGNVGASDTTIPVDTTDGWPVPAAGQVGVLLLSYGIQADVEEVEYEGLTATSFTGCTRGVGDTPAKSHAVGRKVRHGIAADDVSSFSRTGHTHDDRYFTEAEADSRFAAAAHTHASAPSVPAGAVVPFAGSTLPAGWLLCNGQAVSRSTYADLFTAIGTAYGAGDGATTFNVPNMTSRMPLGADGTNLRGSSGGSASHTHTQAAHTHSISTEAAHSHGGPSHTHTLGGHDHNFSFSHSHTLSAHTHTNPTTATEATHTHTVPTTGAESSHTHNVAATGTAGAGGTGTGGGANTGGPSGTVSAASGTAVTPGGGSHTHAGPSHTHTGPDHSHSVPTTSTGTTHSHAGGTSGAGAAHSHTQGVTGAPSTDATNSYATGTLFTSTNSGNTGASGTGATTSDGGHSHGAATGSQTPVIDSTTQLPPWAAFDFIIKT